MNNRSEYKVVKAQKKKKVGGDFAEEEENLVFGYDAAGERHGAALYAGVSIAAVEVHVVGPVGVRHATAAAELRSQRGVTQGGERGSVR